MYDVIQAETLDELVRDVQAKADTGFIPIGGIVFVQYYGRYLFLQSVWKTPVYPIDNWYGKGEKQPNP